MNTEVFVLNIENIFKGVICENDLKKCKALPNGNDNPLVYLFTQEVIDSSNSFGYTKENVISSINIINNCDPNWLIKNKSYLLDGNEIHNAYAALGELCCYGYLISAFGADYVSAIATEKTPTPDFCVSDDNGEKVYIEANTVQMNGEEYDELKEFKSNKNSQTNQRITVREHSIVPFGRQNARCVAENVIHKLCQIKDDENQFYKDYPSALWVDLQSPHINILHKRAESSCPIITFHETIYSNELWYALYGEKGMPIYENYDPIFNIRQAPLMLHNGRFHISNQSIIDAVIFCLPCSTVIYQNPHSKKPIPKWFMEKTFLMRWFSFQGSKTNYPSNDLEKQLEIDKNIINSFQKSMDNKNLK